MKLFRAAYDWVLHWAATPYALPALFAISFVESSFFPIPPDILLIAMTVAVPALWIRYSLFCSIASVLGGVFGYFIGYQFMDLVGQRIVDFYHLQETFDKIGGLYNEHQGWAVAAAGFTPLPYKIFTLAAGTFKINLPTFILASAISRSARFFLVGFLSLPIRSAYQDINRKIFQSISVSYSLFCSC
jgi:Predicted membrane protein